MFPGGGGNGGDGNGNGAGPCGDDDDDTDDGTCGNKAGANVNVAGGNNMVGAAGGNNAGNLGGNLGGAGRNIDTANSGSCFVAGTLVKTVDNDVAIEEIHTGDLVKTFTEEDQGLITDLVTEATSFGTLNKITLMLSHHETEQVEIELLRNDNWLEDYGAHTGETIYLHMQEMGVSGEAEVLAIEPCPALEEGEGRLVTGTFRHTSGEVYGLKLESESNPIGVTSTHPIWSVDRRVWVSAGELEVGETLKTLTGTTQVESITRRPKPEVVYNIEVEGDHVYRVGESGILVHNQSPCDGDADYLDLADRIRGPRGTTPRLQGSTLKIVCDDRSRGWEHILVRHVASTYDPSTGPGSCFCGSPDDYWNLLRQAVSQRGTVNAINTELRSGTVSPQIAIPIQIRGDRYRLVVDMNTFDIVTFIPLDAPPCP